MKKHLITATILMGLLLLIWGMAKNDVIFLGVLTVALLIFMYGCIHLMIIRNTGNSLDLNKLEQKLDDALSNETSESLTNWLEEKRMTNNKAREYTSPLIEELLNEVTPEEIERTNREMENMD